MPRYGMVIDLARCIGCHSCSVACKAENATPAGVFWSHVIVKETGKYPAPKTTMLPVLCMHCANPPCVDVCPTGASYKRPDGIVVVNYDACMGCRYCEAACPYGARTFVETIKGYFPKQGFTPYEQAGYVRHQTGVEEKCNFCLERFNKGLEPACVATCPAYARHFGDLADPNSEVAKLIAQRHGYQLMPELGTNPSVYYLRA
ncbi:MAG TPA: 4Fe-4S dicluster domain-containing protein [Anaerolineae bacterium]